MAEVAVETVAVVVVDCWAHTGATRSHVETAGDTFVGFEAEH